MDFRFLGWPALILAALVPHGVTATNLNVPAFTFVKVYPGQYYDSATVRSNGTLVMNGGAIGTMLPMTSPSVTIEQGGTFVFNDGAINDFENDGVVLFYGGSQSTASSVNRGYVILAGGDPGFQLVLDDGTVDVYYLATNRLTWEIYSDTAVNAPSIRLFSLTNSLAPATYTYNTLPAGSGTPFGKTYMDQARCWAPVSNTQLRTDITIRSNWLGTVTVETYLPIPAFTTTIHRAALVEVGWNSVPGHTYQLQDALDLVASDWENTSGPTFSVGPTTTLIDGNTLLTDRFYRVILRH